MEIVPSETQRGKLEKDLWFLKVPHLADNVVVRTSFIRSYTKRISPMVGVMALANFSSVVIASERLRDHIMTTFVNKWSKGKGYLIFENAGVVT